MAVRRANTRSLWKEHEKALEDYYSRIWHETTTKEERAVVQDVDVEKLRALLHSPEELRETFRLIKGTTKQISTEIQKIHKRALDVYCARKCQSVLPFLNTLPGILDKFLTRVPGSSFIVGAITLGLTLATRYSELFTRLEQDLREFDTLLGSLGRIEDVDSSSETITTAVIDLYVAVMEYWLKVPSVYKRGIMARVPAIFFKLDEFDEKMGIVRIQFKYLQWAVQQEIYMFSKSTTVTVDQSLKIANKSLEILISQLTSALGKTIEPHVRLPMGTLERKRQERLPGTCLWAENLQKYIDWKMGKDYCLWISGFPGAGKTTLASLLIDHSVADCNNITLYYFFLHDEEGTKSNDSMVKSLYCQLLRYCMPEKPIEPSTENTDSVANTQEAHKRYSKELEDYQTELQTLFATVSKHEADWNNSKSFQELLSVTATNKSITIFVDGLDEVSNKEIKRIHNWLWTLRSCSIRPVKLFLSSRPIPDIVNLLTDPGTSDTIDDCCHVEITAKLVMGDIKTFVATMVWPKISEKFKGLNDEEKNEKKMAVIKAIPPLSHGQFQWATLMVNEINSIQYLKELDNLLKEGKCPNDLTEMYIRVILRLQDSLPDVDLEKARYLLRWCACAFRPLKLCEIWSLLHLRISIGCDVTSSTNRKANESIGKRWETCMPLSWIESPDPAGSTNQQLLETESPESVQTLIRRICGCLLEFRPSEDGTLINSTLHFIHLSVKEFLLTSRSDTLIHYKKYSVSNPNRILNQEKCLLVDPIIGNVDFFWESMVYISQPVFRERLMKTRGNAFERKSLLQYCFFEYAATLGFQHLYCLRDIREKHEALLPSTMLHLESFFSKSTVKTWMEGVVGLKSGLELFFLIRHSMNKWLAANGIEECRIHRYWNWGRDVEGPALMDYEATLLHNTNEFHYLDPFVLFPHSFNQRAAIQETFQKLDVGIDPNLLSKMISVDNQRDTHKPWSFPQNLFVGESGDNDFGFIAQDLNVLYSAERGILLIDRNINHPRLVWERLEQKEKGVERVRLAALHHCDKKGGHNLWTTMAADLRCDGLAVAAVFFERPPLSPGKLRLKSLVWKFNVVDKLQNNLENWQKYFWGKKWISAKNPNRPTLPSAETGEMTEWERTSEWATVVDLQNKKDSNLLVDENGLFSGSRSMIAFHGSEHILTPAGIFSFEELQYQNNPWNDIKNHIAVEATVVPRGRKIIGFADGSRSELIIVDIDGALGYGTISKVSAFKASSVSKGCNAFVHVLACAENGRQACVSLRTDSDSLVIAIINLSNGHCSTIYNCGVGKNIGVTHCKLYHGLSESSSSPPTAATKKSFRYLALVLEEISLSNVYTLLVFSFPKQTLVIRESFSERPEGLIFFEESVDPPVDPPDDTERHSSNDKEKPIDPPTLVVLSGGRLAMQFDLRQCQRLQDSSSITSAISVVAQELRTIDYSCTPTVDGHRMGFTFALLHATPNARTPGYTHTATAKISSWIWSIESLHRERTWTLETSSQFELSPIDYSVKQLESHGLVQSMDLRFIAIWIGPTLEFISTDSTNFTSNQSSISSTKEPYVCFSVCFNSECDLVASSWKSLLHVDKWLVVIYQRELAQFTRMQTITLGMKPLAIEFHPAKRILAVSTHEGLHLYQISGPGFIQFLHKVSLESLEGPLKIHTEPNGPASPPSTDFTTSTVTFCSADQSDLAFGYSACGKVIFNQSWNTFIDAEKPEYISDLIIERISGADKNLWSSISEDHPLVMKENQLYVAGQQRFKIFKIRSYLVLGWSADWKNLWQNLEQDNRPTWYRRVVCAVPLSLSRWRAILIFPRPKDERLTVILYPPESLKVPRLPVIIMSPLSFKKMSPTERSKGWLKGHAAGCPYHLGIQAADNIFEDDLDDDDSEHEDENQMPPSPNSGLDDDSE